MSKYYRKHNDGSYVHHDVLPRKEGLDVDHIDGDIHNNSPENLRYLTRSQNSVHRFNPEAGVDWHQGRWRVRFRDKYVGSYDTKEEAIAVRAQQSV